MNEFTALEQRLSTTSQDLWLGSLVWYSFSGVMVAHTQMVALLVQEGINQSLPLPPKDADVFRRVCSKAERKKVPTDQKNIFKNYMVRDLNADNNNVYKRLVVETVDPKGKRLAYEQRYDITFEKATGNIVSKRNMGASVVQDQDAENIVLWIQNEYARQQGCLDSFAVRQWTSHFIQNLSGMRVREGVYFVKTAHTEKIEALERFLQALPGSVLFHSLPLLDDKKQRDMLKQAFEAETSDEIDALITEIQEITTECQAGRKNGVSNTKYESMLNRYHALLERTGEYSELLEEKLSTTNSRLEIFMNSMVQLTAFKK